MSNETLRSLIVTDPSLLDESIDVSGLRTKTDTDPRLLASIADFPGISYDPTSFDYLSDLNELFAYGLPLVDTQAATPPATGTPDSGSGGGGSGSGSQVTVPGGVNTLVTPTNTAEDQRLIDAGIGLQVGPGQPVVAPGEIPVTQAQLDQYNMTPGSNVIPTDPRTMLPQMGTPQEFEFPMGGGADLATLPASPQPIDPLGRLPQLSDIVTQKDVDEPETFLQKIGLGDLDVKKAAVMTALNAAVGKPVSLLIEGLKGILPEQDPRVGIINDLYARDDIGRVAPGELMAGYNPVYGGFLNMITGGRLGTPTQYGLQDAYQERIDTIEESLNKFSKYDITSPDYDPVKTKQQTDKLAKLKADKKKEADALGITAAEDKRLAEAKMRQTIAEAEAAMPPAATTIIDDPIEIEELGRTVIDSRGIPVFITKKEEDALRKQLLEEEISGQFADEGAVELGEMDTTPSITIDPPAMSLAEARAALTQPVDIQLPGARTPIKLGDIDPYQESYIDDNSIFTTGIYESPREKDEFSDEEFMVGDTSIDPKPGDSVLGFGGQLRDDDPAPSGDDRPGPSAPTGPPSMGFQPQSTFDAEEEDETPADRGGGDDKGDGGGRGCVIATHAVNSGAFTKDTKREAVRWCVKNLHRTWWGEAVRRGYRYYGQKAIDEGKAKNHYQEFKDYVAFGTGKRRTLKTAWTFVYRTVQFFIKGLFNAKR
jgi:hypothetical protein